MKNITLVLFFVTLSSLLNAQSIDSLEMQLSHVKGKERIELMQKILKKISSNDLVKTKDYIEKIITISKDLNDPLELYSGYMAKASYLSKRGDFKQALIIYHLVDSLTMSIPDMEKHGRVLYSKAITHFFLGEYVKSNALFLKSAKLGNKDLTIDCYNGLALILMEQEKFKQALIYINQAEQEAKELDNFDIQAIYSTKGLIYKELKQYNKAIEYHSRTLEISLKNNDKYKLAKDYNNLAATYASMKNFSKAEYFYDEALKLKKEVKDKSGEAITLVGHAAILIEQNRLKEGIQMLQSSLKLAQVVGNKSLITYVYKNLESAYVKGGNYKDAFQNQSNHIKLKDSLNNIKFQKEIASLNLKYETEKKEKEIKLQQEEIIRKELKIKNNRLYSIIALMSFIFLSFLVFYYIKRMQHKREKLEKVIIHRKELNKIVTRNKLQEQRIRISRDLHDNIGSQLTFIISSTENLKYLSKEMDKNFKDKLGQIIRYSKDTIAQLRDTIWAINKNQINLEDFQLRVLSFIEKAKRSNEKIKIHFSNHIEKNISFSSIKGVNVFRVLQEAVNNALKYSQASNIYIQLKFLNQQLIIEIIDDGIGFDITTVEYGNGLDNMQRRIEEVGGVFHLNTSPEKGTRISITCNKNTINDV